VLYVYWSATLFRSEYWLVAFDLRAQKELEQRRIDPTDLPPGEANSANATTNESTESHRPRW